MTDLGVINFLLTSSFVMLSPPGCVPVCLIVRNCAAVSSTGLSIYHTIRRCLRPCMVSLRTERIKPAPSFEIHLFLNARACPTFDDSSPTSFYNSLSLIAPCKYVTVADLEIRDSHGLSTRRRQNFPYPILVRAVGDNSRPFFRECI